MSSQKEKIIRKAKEILENSPKGIRYSKLVNRVSKEYPEIKIKAIQWNLFDLHKKFKKIIKPERGLFIMKKYLDEATQKKIVIKKKEVEQKIEVKNEVIFYSPFADYLVNELDECDKAIPLGGNKLKDKWGTPDVIGVYKFSEAEPIRPLPEIVSAEIKTDTLQLITSFGQACIYKLFSDKVYLVIPDETPELDKGRLESLCLKFGIGLIVFNRNNPENPNFRILVRAIKSEPDYFYVNKYLKLLGDKLF